MIQNLNSVLIYDKRKNALTLTFEKPLLLIYFFNPKQFLFHMEDLFLQYCKYKVPINGSSSCCTTRSWIRGKMTKVKFYYFE